MNTPENTKYVLTKLPSEVFNSCPRCDSPNLLRFEGECFCLHCDWDSIELHLDCELFGYHLMSGNWPLPKKSLHPTQAA